MSLFFLSLLMYVVMFVVYLCVFIVDALLCSLFVLYLFSRVFIWFVRYVFSSILISLFMSSLVLSFC